MVPIKPDKTSRQIGDWRFVTGVTTRQVLTSVSESRSLMKA